jgi:16S rRNA (cytidine1402-2'-O)-methyltransferase
MIEVFGGGRRAALCRELTKLHEEVRRGSLEEILQGVVERPPRGEVVLVIDRAEEGAAAVDLDGVLEEALTTMSLRDATDHVAEVTGRPRREVYQAALRLREGEE